MKLTELLSAWHVPGGGRKAQPPNKVPIQEILPLKLKDRVSGKSDKSKVGNCLYEMSLVIACLQLNEYENKLCQKEVDVFQSCYKKFVNDSFQSKRAQEKGVLVPGEKNFTHKQIRKLLRMRPVM